MSIEVTGASDAEPPERASAGRDASFPSEKFDSLLAVSCTRYAVQYRISGHESFPCRYAWLPKAVNRVLKKPDVFVDEQQAMVDLGVGKNMVRAIRFWKTSELFG